MIGSYLYNWLIQIVKLGWQKVKVTGSKAKVKLAVLWKNWFIYKTRMDDSILMKLIYNLMLIREFSWHEVKVTRSRFKVKRAVTRKNLFSLINLKQMIGYWLYNYIWLIQIVKLGWQKVKVTRSKVKVKCTLMLKIGSPIKHE